METSISQMPKVCKEPDHENLSLKEKEYTTFWFKQSCFTKESTKRQNQNQLEKLSYFLIQNPENHIDTGFKDKVKHLYETFVDNSHLACNT